MNEPAPIPGPRVIRDCRGEVRLEPVGESARERWHDDGAGHARELTRILEEVVSLSKRSISLTQYIGRRVAREG